MSNLKPWELWIAYSFNANWNTTCAESTVLCNTAITLTWVKKKHKTKKNQGYVLKTWLSAYNAFVTWFLATTWLKIHDDDDKDSFGWGALGCSWHKTLLTCNARSEVGESERKICYSNLSLNAGTQCGAPNLCFVCRSAWYETNTCWSTS